MLNKIATLVVLAVAVVAVHGATTQPAAPATGAQDAVVLRVYDLSDYLRTTRDYPLATANAAQENATPSAGSNNAQFDAVPAPAGSQQDKIDQLIKAITVTIRPDAWRDAGGSVGSITCVGNKLLVTATPQMQEQVKGLLLELTPPPARMVRITATWLLLSNDELAALRDQTPHAPGQDAIVRLDSKALAKITAFARGTTFGFDRQTVSITTDAIKPYVSNITTSVEKGETDYTPTYDQATTRFALQVTPQLDLSHKSVVVDLANNIDLATVTASRQPTSRPANGAPNHLDLPDFASQNFHTTASIPLGQDILIGGITLNPSEHATSPKELYLVIEAEVSE